jgi:hypothetical protein
MVIQVQLYNQIKTGWCSNIFNVIYLKNEFFKFQISGLVASSPGMTYQSVPIQAGQGLMQAGVQPGFQYSGIEKTSKKVLSGFF